MFKSEINLRPRLSPLQMVSREIDDEIDDMGLEDIESALESLLSDLHLRAKDMDPKNVAMYRVAAEVISYFGTQLIAFHDISIEESGVLN